MAGERVKQLATNDEGFCFDPRTGDTYQLNASSRVLLAALKQGMAEAEVAKHLVEQFDVTLPEALSDTQEFIQLLRIHGLIEP